MGKEFTLIVIGGGIAGTTLVETISELIPNISIGWFSPSFLFKRIKNVTKKGRFMESFDVEETECPQVLKDNPNIVCERVFVGKIDTENKTIYPDERNCDPKVSKMAWKYKYLCLCTGAVPVKIPGTESDPDILTIRDTTTIDTLEKRIKSSSIVMIVGNGGIATELVYKLSNVTIIWVIRDGNISSVFFDPPASSFLIQSLLAPEQQEESSEEKGEPVSTPSSSSSSSSSSFATSRKLDDAERLEKKNRMQPVVGKGHVFLDSGCCIPMLYQTNVSNSCSSSNNLSASSGSSLGPDWSSNRSFVGSDYSSIEEEGKKKEKKRKKKEVIIESECEVRQVLKHLRRKKKGMNEKDSSSANCSNADDCAVVDTNEYYYEIELTNGKVYKEIDCIISATGVKPNVSSEWRKMFDTSSDHGIFVDENMSTNIPDIFAAGDCCTVKWSEKNNHWFQMKLWTQARTLANYASYCIAGKIFPNNFDPKFHFNFDLFTHVTNFFGYKVILIGLYNGQGLEQQSNGEEKYKMLLRIKERESYVKIIVKNGKVRGGILIGETDLEETIENLILSGLDVSNIEDNLLDENIDIEDYFD